MDKLQVASSKRESGELKRHMITNFHKLKVINGNIHEPIFTDRISLSRLALEPIKRLLMPSSPN